MTHQIETGRIYRVSLHGFDPPLRVRAQRQSQDRPNCWECESIATGGCLVLTESAYWRLDEVAESQTVAAS
jgi:hypothetical protein